MTLGKRAGQGHCAADPARRRQTSQETGNPMPQGPIRS
ncbi:hypothetical protein NY78_1057 [Desulfovibrio sp. TomC]|nr:hypothetical protein NY78_1057 [Desulfovibrio sp. TomC]